MSDLISRCELFNRLASVEKSAEVVNIINEMPTAQQWIPCEVRLPEEDKSVLVTVYFKGLERTHSSGWNEHIKPKYYVDIASHIGGSWSSYSDEYKVARNRHEVVAWCELPAPYKGGDADGRLD